MREASLCDIIMAFKDGMKPVPNAVTMREFMEIVKRYKIYCVAEEN